MKPRSRGDPGCRGPSSAGKCLGNPVASLRSFRGTCREAATGRAVLESSNLSASSCQALTVMPFSGFTKAGATERPDDPGVFASISFPNLSLLTTSVLLPRRGCLRPKIRALRPVGGVRAEDKRCGGCGYVTNTTPGTLREPTAVSTISTIPSARTAQAPSQGTCIPQHLNRTNS